ncbi:hypothetical protein DXG01_011016 [Tephrocybe rancida]|nr:hypothetical protein DXG01_011016 [Tephrocybe rancida]
MCSNVTWSTEGDDGAAKDLGGVRKVKNEGGREVLTVELLSARADVECMWTTRRIREREERRRAIRNSPRTAVGGGPAEGPRRSANAEGTGPDPHQELANAYPKR